MAMKIIKNHVRSISLPSRTHPSTAAIEESLEKLLLTMNTTTVTSSESVYSGLEGLEDLYERTDEFLKMGSTQSVLSFNDEKRKMKREFIDEMLDDSLKLMDICNVSRDLMVETHEHVRVLQSCVRRRKDINVSSYLGFRKNMKKEVKKLLGSLKNVNVDIVMRSRHACDQDSDVHLLAVINALRRVVSMTVLVLKSFLEFLSGKNGNYDIRSKLALVLMSKKFHDNNKMVKNELEDVDSAICGDSISNEVDFHMKLKEVEVWIGRFEKNLERLFRGLIKTRTSLLNIISQ